MFQYVTVIPWDEEKYKMKEENVNVPSFYFAQFSK